MTNGPTGDPILDALKAERVRRGWSQTDLAQRLGRKTYNTPYQWESGANEPTLSSLREWAGALGFDVTLTPLPAEQPDPGLLIEDVEDERPRPVVDVALPEMPEGSDRRVQ